MWIGFELLGERGVSSSGGGLAGRGGGERGWSEELPFAFGGGSVHVVRPIMLEYRLYIILNGIGYIILFG